MILPAPAAPLHGLRRVKTERWGKERARARATPRLIASILLGSSEHHSDFVRFYSRGVAFLRVKVNFSLLDREVFRFTSLLIAFMRSM